MKAKFEVKMTNQDMYHFLMYHSYHGFTGIFSIVAGIVLLGYFFWCLGTGREASFLYPFFGVLFLIYQPWTLFISSAKQVTSNPVFRNPIGYELSENGITVSQDGVVNEIGWDGVRRVCEDKRCIFVYTGAKNACIWPKKQLGSQMTQVQQILASCVPSAAVRKKNGRHS